MRFSKLTEEDIEYIGKAYRQGTFIYELAEQFGVTRGTMSAWIDHMKLPHRRKLEWERLTKEYDKKILDLHDKGMTYVQIANELELSKLAVKRLLIFHHGHARKKNAPVRKKRREFVRTFVQNPNPPTELTKTLIRNYYRDNIHKRRLSHDAAVRDISIQLCRKPEYIEEIIAERRYEE